jgi:radical SAM protein with 4Fe4S-binding SPASM domain
LVLRDWASGRNALQKLWDAGIPHVRFADVGWKTTCDNFGQDAAEEQLQTLVAAIEFAEDLGMITGVRALASQLLFSTASASAPALDRLAQVGLDYIVLPWGVEAASHGWLFGKDDYEALLSAVQRASSWEMTAVLEAALVRESVAVLEAEIDRMLVREISHLEVFAMAYHPADTSPRKDAATTVATGEHTPFEARELRQLASWIEDLADHRWLQTIWLPPVCAKGFDRQDGLRSAIVRGPRAGSEFSIRVEADGNVIPAKGPRASVGNIQQMPWAEIWSASAFADIREGARQRELCSECPRLTVCATDCPADYQGWADESESPPSGFRI